MIHDLEEKLREEAFLKESIRLTEVGKLTQPLYPLTAEPSQLTNKILLSIACQLLKDAALSIFVKLKLPLYWILGQTVLFFYSDSQASFSLFLLFAFTFLTWGQISFAFAEIIGINTSKYFILSDRTEKFLLLHTIVIFIGLASLPLIALTLFSDFFILYIRPGYESYDAYSNAIRYLYLPNIIYMVNESLTHFSISQGNTIKPVKASIFSLVFFAVYCLAVSILNNSSVLVIISGYFLAEVLYLMLLVIFCRENEFMGFYEDLCLKDIKKVIFKYLKLAVVDCLTLFFELFAYGMFLIVSYVIYRDTMINHIWELFFFSFTLFVCYNISQGFAISLRTRLNMLLTEEREDTARNYFYFYMKIVLSVVLLLSLIIYILKELVYGFWFDESDETYVIFGYLNQLSLFLPCLMLNPYLTTLLRTMNLEIRLLFRDIIFRVFGMIVLINLVRLNHELDRKSYITLNMFEFVIQMITILYICKLNWKQISNQTDERSDDSIELSVAFSQIT